MREKIKLESSAGTGHFYTTTKNKRTMPDKMEIIKFDPKVRQPRDLQRDQAEVGASGLKIKGRQRGLFHFTRSSAAAARTPPTA